MSEATSGTLGRLSPHIDALMRATCSLIACGTWIGVGVMKEPVNTVTVGERLATSSGSRRRRLKLGARTH